MQVGSKSQRWQPAIIALLLSASMMCPDDGLEASTLDLKGALVAQACTIRAGDEALAIDFGAVTNADLYLNLRTVGTPIQIQLEGCNTTISNMVTTTFSGSESAQLPGFLALGGTVAKGVAIGLETPEGVPLMLNKVGGRKTLTNGTNVIAFQAFIKAEPQAVTYHSIKPGQYTAVSTFTLDYP